MQKLNFIVSSLFLISSLNVVLAGGEDPFTPKASLIRYWKNQISNDLPQPSFLLNKASPLTAVQSATFSKLAAQKSLAAHLPSFCAAAHLLCYTDLAPSLEKHAADVNFKGYGDKNFTNYGTGRLDGTDSFGSYSVNSNQGINSFRRYSRDSGSHNDEFSNYSPDSTVPDQSFDTYGTKAGGGRGDFKVYSDRVTVATTRFSSYSGNTNDRKQNFTSYADNGNTGDQSFTSYGKAGNAAENDFASYDNNSNSAGSTFANYGENGNGGEDSFTSYGEDGNSPRNHFKSYTTGGNGAVETFKIYGSPLNEGDVGFRGYAKSSNAGQVKFSTYGEVFNRDTATFSGYGGGTVNSQLFGFKTYGINNTFKDYADKESASFASYAKTDSGSAAELQKMKSSGKVVNKRVEPGKFFRESDLNSGTVMPMPDIRDRMPKRSFLPRSISSKLPFSTSELGELKKIFHARDKSAMEGMIVNSLTECERAPSQGESKRCVGSVEDMIDFATLVLGRNIEVRTTESTNGSKGNVMIGDVKGINRGKVTKSVSCHQSLFPYLLYYCHSVPKVRVYEADLLDPKTKSKINHGIAICHIDTSAWSSTHGAFLALGSSPGKIEVCHWIFENDMTWTIAD